MVVVYPYYMISSYNLPRALLLGKKSISIYLVVYSVEVVVLIVHVSKYSVSRLMDSWYSPIDVLAITKFSAALKAFFVLFYVLPFCYVLHVLYVLYVRFDGSAAFFLPIHHLHNDVITLLRRNYQRCWCLMPSSDSAPSPLSTVYVILFIVVCGRVEQQHNGEREPHFHPV